MKIITINWTNCKSQELIEIQCDVCLNLFTKTKKRLQDSLRNNHSKKLFCSSICFAKYNDTRVITTCSYCTTEIFRSKKEIKNNCFCSHSCAAKFSNANSIFKKRGPEADPNSKRQILKNKPKRKITNKWAKNYSHICQQCQKQFIGESFRKYCSVACSRQNSFHPNSFKVHKHKYNGYNLDSGAELYFAQQLDLHHINWIKNDGIKFKQSFPFIDDNGKLRKYYPDFLLPDYNIWVEIKGRRYIRTDDDLRMASVLLPVKLLISNEFKLNIEPFFKNLAESRMFAIPSSKLTV